MISDSLCIVGSGGHACVVYDAAIKSKSWKSILIIDYRIEGFGLAVDDLYTNRFDYIKTHTFFVAIGDNKIREKILNELFRERFSVSTIIHPSAIIAESCLIDMGTCVLAGSVINPFAKIGKGVIVNTGVRIDHHDIIGDYTHLSPGSILTGAVTIGKGCFVGAGAIFKNGVKISDDIIIGAGGVVVKDIEKSGTYVGVPVKIIKSKN